jgi:hypothetical protein
VAVEESVAAEKNPPAEASEAVNGGRSEGESLESGADQPGPPHQDNEIGHTNVWPDEAAESAFIAEARDRGETVTAAPASAAVEESDGKNLPSLDALVKRLSPEVRETLDDLFRAKFVSVRRVPKKALNP